MSKYVESYWAEQFLNGVIHLCINCSQREIYYHGFSDTKFLIAGSEEEYEDWNGSLILEIEEFLPKLEKGIYVRTSVKEKDQISFYWIPVFYANRKSSKVLIEKKL